MLVILDPCWGQRSTFSSTISVEISHTEAPRCLCNAHTETNPMIKYTKLYRYSSRDIRPLFIHLNVCSYHRCLLARCTFYQILCSTPPLIIYNTVCVLRYNYFTSGIAWYHSYVNLPRGDPQLVTSVYLGLISVSSRYPRLFPIKPILLYIIVCTSHPYVQY